MLGDGYFVSRPYSPVRHGKSVRENKHPECCRRLHYTSSSRRAPPPKGCVVDGQNAKSVAKPTSPTLLASSALAEWSLARKEVFSSVISATLPVVGRTSPGQGGGTTRARERGGYHCSCSACDQCSLKWLVPYT